MEKLMQFVWAHRLWNGITHHTSDGQKVRIIHPGVINENAGPDFFNASIEIDGERWVGNIELHIRASDWYRHGHDKDSAYDSIILHVVLSDDARICRADGSVIPQITVKCSNEAAERCNALMNSAAGSLPCATTIRGIDNIHHTEWLTALGMERLMQKSDRVLGLVDQSQGSWESAAYITLARALGFGLNSEPFEVLTKNLPLHFLNRHRDELLIVEGLIFGQAGLIPPPAPDEEPYITNLRREYLFMARKFNLHPLPLQWKMTRTRPQNFPHRRLALLAEKIHTGFRMVGRLDDLVDTLRRTRQAASAMFVNHYPYVSDVEMPYLPSLEDIRNEFDINLTGFWATRFTFSSRGYASPKALTAESLDKLVINVALPLLMARARVRGDDDTLEIIPELLRTFRAEDNKYVRLFATAGVLCRDAFDSQAVIQLRREYCEKQKCLFCRFGHRMLSAEIRR